MECIKVDGGFKLKCETLPERQRIKELGGNFIPNKPSGWLMLDCIQKDLRYWQRSDLTGWDPEFKLTPPKIYTPHELHYYQHEACMLGVHYGLFGYILDKGLGKSATAITTMENILMKEPDANFIYVCPKSLFITVKLEIEKWGFSGKLRPFICDQLSIPERAKKVLALNMVPGAVCITSYETFRAEKDTVKLMLLAEDEWSAIFLDESSKIRNDTQYMEGLFLLRNLFKRRFIMSGNPAPYTLSDYVYQCGFLHPAFTGYVTKKAFEKDFGRYDQYGKVWNWDKKAVDWLHERMREIGYVLLKSDANVDLLPWMPPVKIVVTLSHDQQEIYNRLEMQGMAILEEKIKKLKEKQKEKEDFEKLVDKLFDSEEAENFYQELLDMEFDEDKPQNPIQAVQSESMVVASHILAMIVRLSQITGGHVGGVKDFYENPLPIKEFKQNPKMDALIEQVEEARKPCIVWAKYNWEIQKITEVLKTKGWKIGVITGATDTNGMERVQRKFNASEIDVLVINPQKGGFGLNLQHASVAIFYSTSYRREDRQQAEDRINRLGQKFRPTIVDIVAENTIDEDILAAQRASKNLAMSILQKVRERASEVTVELVGTHYVDE